MEIEQQLEKLKREYKATLPSDLFINNSWDHVEKLLGKQDKGFIEKSFYTLRFLTVPTLIMIFFLSIIGVSQASIPGDILYPMKRLSEEAVLKVYPKSEITTERRAQEIIKLIEKKKDGKALKSVVGDYKKSIEDEKKKLEKESDERKRLKVRIEKNREEFRKVSEKNSSFEKENKDYEKAIQDVLKDEERDDEDKDREREDDDNNENSGSVKGESDNEDNSGKGSGDD